MKKLGVFILLGVMLSQVALGACEDERHRRDRAKELADNWGKASETGSVVGGVAGGVIAGLCTANPFVIIGCGIAGGLAGGGVPGVVCARLKALYDYREEVLRVCMENYNNQQLQNAENAKIQLIQNHAQNMGTCLSGMFRNKMNHYIQVANTEINAKINEYIDNDEDLSDPTVQSRLQSEVDAINRKYF